MLKPKKKQVIIKKTQIHEKDTGSSNVQAAILVERIEMLSGHLKKHPKDNHSRRGLIKLVSLRRKHEKYIETQKPRSAPKKAVAVKKATTAKKTTAKKVTKKTKK